MTCLSNLSEIMRSRAELSTRKQFHGFGESADSEWVPRFTREKRFRNCLEAARRVRVVEPDVSEDAKGNAFPAAQLRKGYNVPCFSCGVIFGATLQLISTPKYKWRCAVCDAEEYEGMADEHAADFDGEQDVGDDMWDGLATWKP